MQKKKYNLQGAIPEQAMSSSQETLHEEHACCKASLSESFGAERAFSGAPQLVAEEGSHLRTMLNEMTFSQLSVLARSWGVQVNTRNVSHESLYDACSEVVDRAINAPDADATHRRIVTERFFGWRSRNYGCDRSRARSASPGVDLTVEHFDCAICLEKVPSRSTLTLPCCGYEACKACVIQSMKVQIADRSQLRCLHCSAITSHYKVFMDEVLPRADVIAWMTQVATSSVPDCRQCSQCDRIHVVDRASEGFPSVSCKGCGHEFCFDHGDAHAGKSCPPPGPQLIDAQVKISSISKQCPHCKVCIERSGGCPHMTCAVCGCEWCWSCSKPWYTPPLIPPPSTGNPFSPRRYQANHVELLNTNSDDSKNCIAALLHLIICFFIGRDCVFYSADLCSCSGRNAGGDSVHWRRRGAAVASNSPLLHLLLLQAVRLRSALQPASQGRVLCTAYLGGVISYYLLKGAVFAVSSICHGFYASLTGPALTVTYYPLTRGMLSSTLPGPPQLSQQFVHFFFAITVVILCGVLVGLLTTAVMMVSKDGWRNTRNPSSCLPVALLLALPLLGAFCLLPGIVDHDTYIFRFFFVWMASQLCLALFTEANAHCHWTAASSDEFLEFWGFLWGIAAAILKLLMTMDSFDYFLMVSGCLGLAYAFTAAILMNSRYRNLRSTRKLVTKQSILLLTTSAALYTMLPLP
jgi:hypothetical protein